MNNQRGFIALPYEGAAAVNRNACGVERTMNGELFEWLVSLAGWLPQAPHAGPAPFRAAGDVPRGGMRMGYNLVKLFSNGCDGGEAMAGSERLCM